MITDKLLVTLKFSSNKQVLIYKIVKRFQNKKISTNFLSIINSLEEKINVKINLFFFIGAHLCDAFPVNQGKQIFINIALEKYMLTSNPSKLITATIIHEICHAFRNHQGLLSNKLTTLEIFLEEGLACAFTMQITGITTLYDKHIVPENVKKLSFDSFTRHYIFFIQSIWNSEVNMNWAYIGNNIKNISPGLVYIIGTYFIFKYIRFFCSSLDELLLQTSNKLSEVINFPQFLVISKEDYDQLNDRHCQITSIDKTIDYLKI